MSNWKKIDHYTPKDQRILLYYPAVGYRHARFVIGRWNPDEFSKKPQGYWDPDDRMLWGMRVVREEWPTYYQLLEPPYPLGAKP